MVLKLWDLTVETLESFALLLHSCPAVLEGCGNMERGPSIPSPAVSSTCGLSKEGITSQDMMNWKSQTAFLHGKLQIKCTVNRFAKFKKKTHTHGKRLSVYFFSLLIYHNHLLGSQFLSGKRDWQGQGSKSGWKTPRYYGTLIKESKDSVFQTTWNTEASILVVLLCFPWCVNNCNEGPQQLRTGVGCFLWNSRLENDRIHGFFQGGLCFSMKAMPMKHLN